MPNRIPWTERRFTFDFPVGVFPELIERLRGTPARMEESVRGLPTDVLTARDGATWSIQENVGHLADLESLFTDRLDDYDAGAAVLRPADMTNRRTHGADHNARTIEQVTADLRRKREGLVARLDPRPPEDFAAAARHPRLDRPMRLVDMLFFHAEHDDYHLARIRQLIRTLR